MATASELRPARLLLAATLWGTASPAAAMVGDRSAAFGLDGSLRTAAVATFNYDDPQLFGAGNPADGMSQVILRLVAGGYPTDWLSYEVHGVQLLSLEALSGPAALVGRSEGGNALVGATGGSVPYRLAPLELRFGERPRSDVDARLTLDRLSVKLALPHLDVTLGRQALSFGKAYFWNPLDPFLAFNPTQFDRDYKGGADALRFDLSLGDFTGLTVVGVAAPHDADDFWRESGLVGRAFTTWQGWDLALQGGKIREAYQVGAAAAGEVATLEVRLEGAWFFAMEDARPRDHLGVVVGLGRSFAGGLSLQLEHFVNGGAPRDLRRGFELVGQGVLQQASPQVTGLSLSYEILPVLFGSCAAILEWEHSSFLVQPGLSYSAADEVDVVAGAVIAVGERPEGFVLKSELGTYPHFVYVEAKIYF